MFLKLLASMTSNGLSKTKLQQGEAGIIGEATFADTLGVITTALGLIANILAYEDLLVPFPDDEGPPLPPFNQGENKEVILNNKGEIESCEGSSTTNLIIFFNVLVIIIVIALFVFTCLLAGGICQPPTKPPDKPPCPKEPDPCSDSN